MTSLFPSFVNEEDNDRLLEDVSKDEFHMVLHNLKNDKCPSSNSWRIGSFSRFFEIVEDDFMKSLMIEIFLEDDSFL